MNKLFVNIFQFASGSIVGGLFNFVTFFFAAKIVGPTDWGVWVMLSIMLKFSIFYQLGGIESMQRRLPLLIGKGESVAMDRLISNTFSLIVIASTIFLVFYYTVLWQFFDIPKNYFFLFGPVLVMNMFFYFYGILFRSYEKFNYVGVTSSLNGFFSLFALVFAYYYSFTGFLLGLNLKYVLILLFIVALIKIRPKIKIDKDVLLELIKDGFPILTILLVGFAITLSDRVIISHYFDFKELGLYGLSFIVLNPIILISSSINSVVYVNDAKEYGATSKISLQKVFKKTQMLILIFAAIIGLIYFSLRNAVYLLLEDYIGGIEAAKYLLIGHLFYFSCGIISNHYLVIGKQSRRLVILIISVLINILLSILLLKFYFSIEIVSISSLVGFIFLFLALNIDLTFFRKSSAKDKNESFRSIFLMVFFAAAIFLIDKLIESELLIFVIAKALILIGLVIAIFRMFFPSDYSNLLLAIKNRVA